MEMKRVVADNATLPCHHQFWVSDNDPALDIEWLFLKPTSRQKVITYFAGRVYNPNDAERGRVAFAGEYLKGDASLLIRDLSLTDSGEYSCKVKNGAQYHWSTISLIVLVKPSKPQCWMEGKPLEGSDVKMSCKSADGSDPIHYKWERVLDKGKYVGKLPPLAMIDLKNPEIVTLRNLTKDSTGVYKCTASNDVGEESCTVEVKMHCDSRSGTSSTQSMVHNMGPRGQQGCVPAVMALKESCQASSYPRSPPGYNQTVAKTPEPRSTPTSSSTSNSKSSPPPKLGPGNLSRMGATPVMIPAQTKAFQT
ncbi:hypothetical protein INR49_016111, partial [Caranx melampygus]